MTIRNIIFDLNGTMYERGIMIDGACDLVDDLRDKGYQLSFLTNTDSRATSDVYERLLAKGLKLNKDELVTPVSAVKRFIELNMDKSFHLLVHDDVLQELSFANQDTKSPDYVIIGDFCDKVSYDTINEAFRMIRAGAEIIALSKTLWYKDDDGDSINTGAFVHMLEAATGKNALLMGKPSTDFLKMALENTSGKPETTLVIGDDIATDIWGGHKLGATTVQVQTGVYDVHTGSYNNVTPDHVIADVTKLPDILERLK